MKVTHCPDCTNGSGKLYVHWGYRDEGTGIQIKPEEIHDISELERYSYKKIESYTDCPTCRGTGHIVEGEG